MGDSLLLKEIDMAARVTSSVVDFVVLGSKIPAAQKNSFAALRSKVEGHLRNVNSLPGALPAIDFAAYNKVTVPGMVDNFQKKYAALQIPYPSDNGAFKAIDERATEQKAAYNQFVVESNAAIEALKTEMATFEAMKPVEEMNIEEALDAGLIGNQITGMYNPDKPSFWPHDET